MKKNNFYDIFDDEKESLKIQNRNVNLKWNINSNIKVFGRKTKIDKENETGLNLCHNKYIEDNKRNKIMNNFLKFLIAFLNENKKNDEKFLFLKLKRKKNKFKTFNFSSIQKIFNLTIFEFCEKEISVRNNKLRKQVFEINPIDLINLSKNFYEKKICDFYQNFFLSNKKNQFNGLFCCNLSKSEKLNFNHFLNKFEKEVNYQIALKKTANNLIELINNFHSKNIKKTNSTLSTEDFDIMSIIQKENDNSDEFYFLDQILI